MTNRDVYAVFLNAGSDGVNPRAIGPDELARLTAEGVVRVDPGTGRVRLTTHGHEVMTGVPALQRRDDERQRFVGRGGLPW